MAKLIDIANTFSDLSTILLFNEEFGSLIDRRISAIHQKMNNIRSNGLSYDAPVPLRDSFDFGEIPDLDGYFNIQSVWGLYYNLSRSMPSGGDLLLARGDLERWHAFQEDPKALTDEDLEYLATEQFELHVRAFRQKRFYGALFTNQLNLFVENGLGAAVEEIYNTLLIITEQPDRGVRFGVVDDLHWSWQKKADIVGNLRLTPAGALKYQHLIYEAFAPLKCCTDEQIANAARNMRRVAEFDHALLNSYLTALTPEIAAKPECLTEIVDKAVGFDAKKNEKSRSLVHLFERYIEEANVNENSRLMSRWLHDSVVDFYLIAAPRYMLEGREHFTKFHEAVRQLFDNNQPDAIKTMLSLENAAHRANISPDLMQRMQQSFLDNYFLGVISLYAELAIDGIVHILTHEKEPAACLSLLMDYCVVSTFLNQPQMSDYMPHVFPKLEPGKRDEWIDKIVGRYELNKDRFLDWLRYVKIMVTRPDFRWTQEALYKFEHLMAGPYYGMDGMIDLDLSDAFKEVLDISGFNEAREAFMPVAAHVQSFPELAHELDKIYMAVRFGADISAEPWYAQVYENLVGLAAKMHGVRAGRVSSIGFNELTRLASIHYTHEKEPRVVTELVKRRTSAKAPETAFPLGKVYHEMDLSGVENRASAPEMAKYLIWGLISRDQAKQAEACRYYSREMIMDARKYIETVSRPGKIFHDIKDYLPAIEQGDVKAVQIAVMMLETHFWKNEILLDLLSSIQALILGETIFDKILFKIQDGSINDLFLYETLESCAFKNHKEKSHGATLYALDPAIALLHVVPTYNNRLMDAIGVGILVDCVDNDGRSYLALDTFEGGKSLDRIRGNKWRTHFLESVYAVGRDTEADYAFINFRLVDPNEQPRRFYYHCLGQGLRPIKHGELYLRKVGGIRPIKRFGFDKHLLDMFSPDGKTSFNEPEGYVHGAVVKLK